jgi:Methyltransferase domain
MFAKMPDNEFLSKVTDNIDGWLIPVTAHLTLELLRAQRQLDSKSGLLEIGIYEGKSWSLALKEAIEANSPVLGIDTFQFFSEQHVCEKLDQYFPNYQLLIHRGKSTDFSAERVKEVFGGEARFVSIDGSHMAPDVEYDLDLAAAVLADAGIVSVDDFLNPMTLGVNEAVGRFMIKGAGGLSPFCYCMNKLFMSLLSG